MNWKHIYITTIIMISCCLSANAQVQVQNSVDTGVITASGYLNGYEETNIISIDVKNDSGEVVHTSYIPTSDGNFEYMFKLPDVTEDYVFTFSSYSNKEEVSYTSISSGDAENIISGLNGILIDENSSNDENSVVAILENNIDVFSLNSYFWNDVFSAEQKKTVANAVLQNRGTGYLTFDEVRDVVKTEYAITSFAVCKTAEDTRCAFDNFKDVYKIDENTSKFAEYNKLSDTKKEILNIIVSNEIKSENSIETLQNIYDIVDRGMLLALINNSSDPLSIKNWIDNNRTDITFDLTTYDTGNKDVICPYLFGKDIYSMKDLEQFIKDAIDTVPKPSNPQSGGSVGGGVSSGVNLPIYPASQAPKPISSFVDMGDTLWAVDAVNYLADKKIINGVGDNRFAPNERVTREQFLQMIVLAFGFEGEGSTSFADVSPEHWAYPAISAAIYNNITKGTGDSLFGLGESITRQDMAVMASRAISAKGYTLNNKNKVEFTDENDIANYAKESVRLLSESGIINGLGDNKFGPNGVATRAQAAKIIYGILQVVE